MLNQLYIDKGMSHLKKSREIRSTEPLHSLKHLYISKDYLVKAVLENNFDVRYRAYALYKEVQNESWDLAVACQTDKIKPETMPALDNNDNDDWIDNAIVTSDFTFDDIIGYDYIKEKFRVHIIYPMTKDMPFKIRAGNTVLMYGPPGCGKSFFSGALSNEIADSTMYFIDASNVLSKYYGETSRNISKIFSKLKENGSNVLFIDEIDAISMSRDNTDSASNRTLSTLLTQIDGIDKTEINLIAATNRPDMIDSALLSRFNSSLYIPPPGEKEKGFIFGLELDRQIDGYTPEINVDDIVHYMEDKENGNLRYSGRDIRRIVTNALEIAAIDYVVNNSFSIDNKLFYQVIDETSPSIDRKMLRIYEDFRF
ncbi:MAG: ATP-binding protein [Candidatus Aenigmarchaeota archaeon]|nr:ATP-binding protein [Candidatus Aenigmarchaeota archaeon]MCK5062635.1 ATP-binding protein [Candidatus Aenigmarchaeota archaeon]MCK5234500.1 ATP-binding protein [Candidatus Aenigmarchaeota archaeon]MCK5289310.1 ATP-binding protein [Candidatus Aenigmarchaeota archaeon]MCK5452207.1 ATP-binding protein [Candidatus Aenigmarchaeota archaeon]